MAGLTHALTQAQVDALRMLKERWHGRYRFALIGATAMAIQLPPPSRATEDIDVIVVVDDVSFDAVDLDWERFPGVPHRWRAPNGVEVDVLPVGKSERAPQEIGWPGGGRTLNLLGLRHAFLRSRSLTLEPGLDVELPGLPVIALLKMISFEDRPSERGKDLGDLALLLDEWLPIDADARFGQSVPPDLDSDLVGAYLLGEEIGGFALPVEVRVVRSWCARLRRDDDPVGARSKMIRSAPLAWRGSDDGLDHRLDALMRGLDVGLASRSEADEGNEA